MKNLDQWEKHFNALLENDVDEYIEEHAEELFEHSRMNPIKRQKEEAKKEVIKILKFEEASESIDRALNLIRDFLPQHISASDWEEIVEEFANCDEVICDHFEKQESGEISFESYTPIHKMCGISNKTLKHCYELGQYCFKENDFDDARCIFGFLTMLAPQMIESWISCGMCYNKMQEFENAIITYNLAKEVFPNNPTLSIHCANNYISLGDNSHAKEELDRAEELFNNYPELKSEWEQTFQFLSSRVNTNYKKI